MAEEWQTDSKPVAKDNRLWAPFPIEMDEHPKIIGLSDAAFRAVFEATFYSRRMTSDGFLDERVVLKRWGQDVADELSSNDPERPSWVRVESGWQIHNFSVYHPLRAQIEEKRAMVSKRRSEAGKSGAAKRWADKEPASEWQTDSKAVASDSSETETDAQTETKKPLVQPSAEREIEFSEFWTLYPRKQGKADARKAFLAARKKHDLAVILAGVQAYTLSSLGSDKSFLKLPGGWLRGERWADEELTATTAPPRSTGPAECYLHDGYPMPCAKCEREGNEF